MPRSSAEWPDSVGNKVLVRTVTHYHTGEIADIRDNGDLLLKDACWIADTGRFHDALKNSTFNEIEPFPKPVVVKAGAIVDVTCIDKLPKDQK